MRNYKNEVIIIANILIKNIIIKNIIIKKGKAMSKKIFLTTLLCSLEIVPKRV